MRILLLGDYSGFYVNLKNGLKTLGHDVTLMSNGDLWKRINGADRQLFHLSSEDTFPQKIYNRIFDPIINRNIFCGYDLVQSIHSVVFDPFINTNMMKFIKQNNNRFFINLCGSSIVLYNWWRNEQNTYYPYSDCPEKTKRFESYLPSDILNKKSELAVTAMANGIIPTSVAYAKSIETYNNACKIIPLPIDLSQCQYSENKLINNKVKFYHGITRPGEKGTPYIKEAMEHIKSKYPNDVDIVLTNRLTFLEYIETLCTSNVLIEACTDVDWGMSALFAMAHGKIAMTGAHEDVYSTYGMTSCPIINIEHSKSQIIGKMEYVLDNRSLISQWGQESVDFVRKYHDSTLVAQQYCDVWFS